MLIIKIGDDLYEKQDNCGIYGVYSVCSGTFDNKFVDCAIASNAELIVTNDAHFDILKTIEFPKLEISTLQKFSSSL